MTRWFLLVLVACSTRSAPDVAGVGIPTAIAVEEPPLTGAHGAGIELIGIADEGDAAVTQDSMGGTRLWPTLDGTREPIVVQIAVTTKLAVSHDDHGYVIASLDQGGGAELVRLSPTGGFISHVSVAPDPPIETLAVTAQGVVVVRSDQTLAFLGESGEIRTRLEAPAGSRIKYVVTRHGQTIVLLSHATADGNAMYGHWLDGASWGASTPDFQIDPESIAALSPNGKRLLVDFSGVPYLIDTETGKIVDNYRQGELVGFIDDDTIATVVGGKLVWRNASVRFDGQDEGAEEATAPFAAAAGVMLSVQQGSLVVHTRKRVERLGYQIADVLGMQIVGDRVVVAGSGREATVLDDRLQQRQLIQLPEDGRTLTDVRPIDDRFAIATYTIGNGTWWSLSVVDLEEHKTWQSMTHAVTRGDIRYEPATRLLSVTDSIASYLTPWDDKRHSFETWYRLAGSASEVHLLDPKLAGGLVALATRPVGSLLEIDEIHGDDLKVGAPIAPRRSHRVSGYLAGIDRAGRIYTIDHGDLVVYHQGLETSRIREVGDAHVEPKPSGAYMALLGDQRIRLYDAAGELRWQIAAPLAQRIAWLGDDLVVDYVGGIGKIDAGSGALIKRACGWSFGLSALSTNEVIAGDSICDAQ